MGNGYVMFDSEGQWSVMIPLARWQAALLLILWSAICYGLQQPHTLLTRLWLTVCIVTLSVTWLLERSDMVKLAMLEAVLLSACIVIYAITRRWRGGSYE